MFWNMNYNSKIESIETILAQPNISLDELLDEDELLQECKANNEKLVGFLVLPATLQTLVKYITTMPSPDDPESRRYKYPYVASEVLCSDVHAIHNAMIANDGELIVSLFTLLDQPAPLPPILVGYLSKVVLACFKAQPEAFRALVNADEGSNSSPLAWPRLMPRLLAHLGSDSILQLLTTVCISEASVDDSDGGGGPTPVSSLLPIDELVPALLSLLPAEADTSANAAELLCCLLSAPTELPPCLGEQQIGARVTSLIECCVGRGPPLTQPLNKAAVEVLVKLLARCREQPISPTGSAAIAEALLGSIDVIFVSLAAPPARSPHLARLLPEGGRSFPLGSARQRFILLALLEEALLTGHEPIATALIDLGLCSLVLDVLLLPHSCNILHMRAVSILERVISTTAPHGGALRKSLVETAELVPRLLALVSPASAPGAEGREAKPPPASLPSCHGFVMSFASSLVNAAQRDTDLAALLEASEGWAAFVAPSGPLAEWCATQSKPLGGRVPTQTSDESDDDDDDDLALPRGVLGKSVRDQISCSSESNDAHTDDLARIAQYLSRHNFIDDGGEDLDDLSDQQERRGAASEDFSYADEDDEERTYPDSEGIPGTTTAHALSNVAPAWNASFDEQFDLDNDAFADLGAAGRVEFPTSPESEMEGSASKAPIDLNKSQADMTEAFAAFEDELPAAVSELTPPVSSEPVPTSDLARASAQEDASPDEQGWATDFAEVPSAPSAGSVDMVWSTAPATDTIGEGAAAFGSWAAEFESPSTEDASNGTSDAETPAETGAHRVEAAPAAASVATDEVTPADISMDVVE